MSATNEVTSAAQEQAGAVAATTKDQAANVAGTAGQAAQDVAGTAKDQAANVAAEVKTQARDLLGDTRSQVRGQTGAQTQRLAQTVRSVAEELSGLASGHNDQPGPATDVVAAVADRAKSLASHLEGSSPDQLLEDLRRFARQRTGLFLFAAGAAGFLTARLAKAASSGSDEGPTRSTPDAIDSTSRPAVTAAPPSSSAWETTSMGTSMGESVGAATTEASYYGAPAVADPSPSPASSAMSGDLPDYGSTGYSEPGTAEAAPGGIRPGDPVTDHGAVADDLLADELLNDERGLR